MDVRRRNEGTNARKQAERNQSGKGWKRRGRREGREEGVEQERTGKDAQK